ncbi:MAG: PKD domain-containing protein [Deltaproteobacteria bacterium]|nr:PKD domain-containing protein [Deltaproteobacteria bacterium]
MRYLTTLGAVVTIGVGAGVGPARAATFSATCADLQATLDGADAGDLVVLTTDCHLGASSPAFVMRRNFVTLEGLADGGAEPETSITADGGAAILGLQITGNDNQVRRLRFTGFGLNAIRIEGAGFDAGTGLRNFLGMDGGAAKDQVFVIGTTFPASFGATTPCQGAAICIRGNEASDNIVDTAFLTNNFIGVEIIDSAHKNTVRGCTITGSSGFGILVARGRDPVVASASYLYNFPNNLLGNTIRQSGIAGIALFGTDPQTLVEDAGDRVLGNTVQCTTGVLPNGGVFPSFGFTELTRLMQLGRLGGTGIIVGSDGDRGSSGNALVGTAAQPNIVQWNAGYGVLNLLAWDTVYDSNVITDNQKSGFADVLSFVWFYVPQFYALQTQYNSTFATQTPPLVVRNTILRNGAALAPGSIASCTIAPADASVCAVTPFDAGGWIGDNDGVFLFGSTAILRGNNISFNAGYGLSAHIEYGQYFADFYNLSTSFIASPAATNDDTRSYPTLGAPLSIPASSFPSADKNMFEGNRLGGALALDCITTAQAYVADYNDFSRANCGNASFTQAFYGGVELLREIDAGVYISVDSGVDFISIRSLYDASTFNAAGDGGPVFSGETTLQGGATGNGIWGPPGVNHNDARTWFRVPAFEVLPNDGGYRIHTPHSVEVFMNDAGGRVASTVYSFDGVSSTERGIQRRLAPGVTDSKSGLDSFQIASAVIPLPGAVGATAVIDTVPSCLAAPLVDVRHTYAVAGTYTMTLTLRDAAGQTLVGTRGVTILTTNAFGIPVGPPQLRIIALPTEGNAPLAVSFSSVATPGLNATSIDGYLWDFGDGTTATTASTSKTFASAGSQRVKLTVVDNNGVTTRVDELILVTADGGRPPTVEAFASTVSGDGPITVTFSALTNPTEVASTVWDFGDDAGAQTGKTVVHSFSTPGIYTTRVTVTDNGGLTGRDSVEVIVTKNGKIPPKIISIGGATADVGISYVYDSDNRVAVRGTPPFVFQVGKSVGGATVNTVSGFTISPATGLVDWVPMASQGGGQTFDLSVTVTGASQTTDTTFLTTADWRVTVSGGANALKAVRGCSCSLDSQGEPNGIAAFVAFAALLFAIKFSRNRSRRRRVA